jgi:hypothetical protein
MQRTNEENESLALFPEIPSPDEIEKIIQNTSGLFHKSLFLALYHAGLRSQEARSLKMG